MSGGDLDTPSLVGWVAVFAVLITLAGWYAGAVPAVVARAVGAGAAVSCGILILFPYIETVSGELSEYLGNRRRG
jgi:hypothetical protein